MSVAATNSQDHPVKMKNDYDDLVLEMSENERQTT